MIIESFSRRISPAIVLWLAVAGCVVLVATIAILGAATPGYDVARETTSQLMDATAKYPVVMRSVLALYALSLVPMALQISSIVRAGSPWAALLGAGLWIHIFFCLVDAAFQNDSARVVAWSITENQIHDGSAPVLYAGGILSLASAALSAGNPLASRFTVLSALLSLFMFVAGLAFVLDWDPGLNGVFERGGMVAFMLWVTAVAIGHSRGEQLPVKDATGL